MKLFPARRIDDGLEKGDILNFTINNNFIVDYFDGTKSIVVSTTSSLGGRNEYWGQSFVTVGVIVLVLALLIGVSLRLLLYATDVLKECFVLFVLEGFTIFAGPYPVVCWALSSSNLMICWCSNLISCVSVEMVHIVVGVFIVARPNSRLPSFFFF